MLLSKVSYQWIFKDVATINNGNYNLEFKIEGLITGPYS